MNGKFAIVFLVAVCLVQGYQSRVAEPRGLIEDAINSIKEIVKKIEDAVSETISQIPDIIKNLEDKIKEIISNIHLDEIVQSIQDKIQEAIDKILTLAGVNPDAVKDCIDAEKSAVKQLIDDTTAGVSACQKSAEDEVAELGAALEELKKRADTLVASSTGSIKQCIDEHGIVHVAEVVKCLKGHLEELKADADSLIAQVKTTIGVANEKLVQVPIALTKCVAKVSSDVVQKEQVIVDDFKKCVEAYKDGQEPEQPEQ